MGRFPAVLSKDSYSGCVPLRIRWPFRLRWAETYLFRLCSRFEMLLPVASDGRDGYSSCVRWAGWLLQLCPAKRWHSSDRDPQTKSNRSRLGERCVTDGKRASTKKACSPKFRALPSVPRLAGRGNRTPSVCGFRLSGLPSVTWRDRMALCQSRSRAKKKAPERRLKKSGAGERT